MKLKESYYHLSLDKRNMRKPYTFIQFLVSHLFMVRFTLHYPKPDSVFLESLKYFLGIGTKNIYKPMPI